MQQQAAASGGNAPLSIAPSQDEGALPPPPRGRTVVARQTAPAPQSSGPTDITPSASAAAAPPAPVARAAAPAAEGVGGGGYAVQVTSQRSEASAQSEYRALQAKYPDQLGSRQAVVRRADLGDKGVYYRAMVGPFASAEQAAGLCSSLKAAGGNCIVQRN